LFGPPEQLDIGGNAIITQFPHISLNGFGIFVPTGYGQAHIAIPTPRVSVGAIYNLNCEVAHPNIPHTDTGLGGQTGITELAGNDTTGIHLPSV